MKANIACVLTLSNLLCGFFAIMLVKMEMPHLALAALLVAFVCDGLDGAVARKAKMTSAFGERLDSLSDLTSFGMAPLFFALNARPEWEVGLTFVSGLYLVCGAVRLARYDPAIQKKLFSGMPIPMAGLLLTSLALTWPPSLPGFDFAPGLIGLLMISDIPFRKVSFQGRDILMPLSLGAGGVLVLSIWHDLAFATLAFTFPYLVFNLMAAVALEFRARTAAIQARMAAARRRRLAKEAE